MKKIFLCSVMLLFVIAINSQSYNSIVLNLNDGTKDTILINEIDSITYDDLGRQIVWSKDSLYRTAISSLNSTTFEKFELPNLLVKTDVIGDWSEMRIHKDGSLIALKKQDGQDLPSDGCMIMPDETLGVLYSSFRIDENGMPKYITINDCVIIVDDYYDNYVDITVAYNDTIAYSLDSIPYSRILTRASSENNWQRNLTGIIELASGAVSIVDGALLITGSVISETGSLGASTPISIPGILAGSATIAGGLSSINTGRKKLYISGASQSNIGETIYYQAAGELIANGPQNAYVPEKYFSYMKDPNYSSLLGKVGWINFWVCLTSEMFDNLFGRTVTWDDIRKYYQGKVITGLSKDITTNSATIRGYISPDITKSLLNGSKIENEYGVILYSTKDETERYIQKEINGNGGTIEYNFYNLKPATPYNYRIFYIDKTNGINILGDIKTFTTYSQTSIEVQSPSKYAYLSKKNITEASHCNEPLWRFELDCPYFNHFSPNVYGFGILPNHGSSVEIPLDVSCIRIWMPEGFINHPNDFGSLRYYYKEDGKEVTIPSRFEYSQIWEEPYPITTSLDNLTLVVVR